TAQRIESKSCSEDHPLRSPPLPRLLRCSSPVHRNEPDRHPCGQRSDLSRWGIRRWLAIPLKPWPSPQRSTAFSVMPQRAAGFFHLHLVSDATGETLITVARAAAAQYASVTPIEHIYPLVRTDKQMERVISEVEAGTGIVLYTMLDSSLAERLQGKCREVSIPCLSILD